MLQLGFKSNNCLPFHKNFRGWRVPHRKMALSSHVQLFSFFPLEGSNQQGEVVFHFIYFFPHTPSRSFSSLLAQALWHFRCSNHKSYWMNFCYRHLPRFSSSLTPGEQQANWAKWQIVCWLILFFDRHFWNEEKTSIFTLLLTFYTKVRSFFFP